MSAPLVRSPVHLAVSLDGAGHYDPGYFVRLARLAEQGTLDFVTLGDSFARAGLDALAVLSRVAPATERIGLVPVVNTTHTEPFHVSSAVATLDWVSGGRAGWSPEVSTSEAEARLFGRRPAARTAEVWHEAREVADVAAKLWDSWEDDAEIRDEPTGRFIDRDKLHYVDFEGRSFSVRGPAIVPRPPQGHPVTVIDATAAEPRAAAVRHADVALVRTQDPLAARTARGELHDRARAHGRDPERLRVFGSLPVALATTADAVELAGLIGDWHQEGAVDGFHLRLAEPGRDLALIVKATVPVLQHRGLLRSFYPGATLREHLGLARPVNQYATAGGGRHERG